MCIDAGIAEDDILTYEADCWNHLMNVWVDTVLKQLSNRLKKILEADLNEISLMLHVTTKIPSLLIALEKYF